MPFFSNLLRVGTITLVSSITVYSTPVLDARQATPSLPTGWVSAGCFSDVTNSRTLRVASFTDVNNMTIESCLAFCTPSGYNFAGVEFSRECYCDNVIESPGSPIDETNCNMPCTGNPTELCGGAGAINVFQNTAIPPPPPPPSIKKDVGSFQYVGCFQDAVNGAPRSLQTRVIDGHATAESCTAACQAQGFALAGLEFGGECWCDSYLVLPTSAPDSDCNSVCDGDSSELCGAGNRLAVYQDTHAPVPQCLTHQQLRANQFNLNTISTTGSGASFLLGADEDAAHAGDPRDFFTMRVEVQRLNDQFIFSINSDGSLSFNSPGGGVTSPISLTPGVGPPRFVTNCFSNCAQSPNPAFCCPAPFTGYCAQPNPVSQFGPFVGPPVLTVNTAATWSLCGDITGSSGFLSLSSPSGSSASNCTAVYVEMTPPIVLHL